MRTGGLSGLVVAAAAVLTVGGVTAMDTPSETEENSDADAGSDYADDEMEPGSGDLILVSNKSPQDADSDSATCDNPDTSSLRAAAADAGEEDRILLCEGTYDIDSKPVTLDADGVTVEGKNDVDPSAVTIDAEGYEKDDAPFRITGDDVDIKNMEFSGSPGNQIHASDVAGLNIDNNEFTDSGDSPIAVGGSAGSDKTVIENNTIDVGDAESGMMLRNTENATVASNEITGARDAAAIALGGDDDTIDIQGNRVRGGKDAVKLSKYGDDGSGNADVDAHMNSFEKGVEHGVAVESGAAGSDSAVDADDNYWGCAAGADESGCAGTDVTDDDASDDDASDDDEVDISTDDSLRAPIEQSRTSTNVRDDHRLTTGETDGHDLTDMDAYAQGWEGHGTVTATTFEGNPRATDVSDTAGKFLSVTATGDFDDGVDVDTGVWDKAHGDKPLLWSDSEDGEWQQVQGSDTGQASVSANIEADTSPAWKDLRHAVFVAQDK